MIGEGDGERVTKVPEGSDPDGSSSQRTVLRDSVAERIQARILSGALRPGDRLPPERELAERLKVNRSSVREALKQLEQLGLVTSQQGSGTRVRSIEEASLDVLMRLLFLDGRPNIPWIRDYLDLRAAVAPGVLKLVVERASKEEVDEIAELFHRCADAGLSDADYLDSVLSASDSLARASHNRAVMQLWNSLRRVMTHIPFQNVMVATSGSRPRFTPGLKRLAVALQARDLATAERAVLDVLSLTTELFLAALDAPVDQPAPRPRSRRARPRA
jgi:GntR family transcriptional repressor for pyruvate dehydrogenase complex